LKNPLVANGIAAEREICHAELSWREANSDRMIIFHLEAYLLETACLKSTCKWTCAAGG
jgi:hypothetical protein